MPTETCGACRFAMPIAMEKNLRECGGMPPTMFVLAANRNVLGQPQLNIQTMSPRVAVDRRACSLYRPLLDN